MNIPELLAPAGGLSQLITAVRFGADAVYLGMPRFGLRSHAKNFPPEDLEKGIAFAHSRGAKVYVTLNIFATDEDLPGIAQSARQAQEAGADGLIMADPGAICVAREAAPGMPIHLSTQMSTMNAASARFWRDHGVSRIVLAREMSLAQIQSLHDQLPEGPELEMFVHGAVCMAYSGRCAISKYLAGRDGNRGDCAQPCRWTYTLSEERRPGVYFPVVPDGEGMQLLSACDMNLMPLLPQVCGTGVASLKIEGRMKNDFYIATVVGAYRRALDALRDGRFTGELMEALNAELCTVSHRPYDTGFALGQPSFPGSDALRQTRELSALVVSWANGQAVIRLKNRLFTGDALELMTPEGIFPFTLAEMRDESGQCLSVCAKPESLLAIPLQHPAEAGDLIRGTCRNHPCSE